MIRDPRMLGRRRFLELAGGATLALPTAMGLLGRSARAAYGGGVAKRLIVFYFPDGVVGPSQDGDASKWHAQGSEFDFELSGLLEPLGAFKSDCVFLNGLHMGATDSGSHPGGARKLLTGVDHGNGESIDQLLARTAGSSMPFHHVFLGAAATHNGASGDKFISYPNPGQTTAPNDDPIAAFQQYFGSPLPPGVVGAGKEAELAAHLRTLSVLDAALSDLGDLRGQMGKADKAKLDLHLDALHEVEQRVQTFAEQATSPDQTPPSCDDPALDTQGLTSATLYEPEQFPTILRLQTDILVQAMACGLTGVGVLQGSHHTSELIMSRFAGTEMYDPGYDMRSHQASHYGSKHDPSKLEYAAFRQQRRWWVEQFAYLLAELKARPEDDGTMLDHSVVLLCTEVCDGNTHAHDNMPFVVAGQAGGCISTGRLLQPWGTRHSNLLVSLAHAMGETVDWFGQDSSGPLSGLVG